jgi:hypothetical protein
LRAVFTIFELLKTPVFRAAFNVTSERGAMKKERRKNRRFIIDQLFEISLAKEIPISAKGVNISKGGVFCEVGEPLDLSSRAFLMITLQHEEGDYSFSCEGMITRCKRNKKKYLAAIQLTDLTADQKRQIGKMLK